MRTITAVTLAIVSTTAFALTAAHLRPPRLPSDFRDAVAGTSALEALGGLGTGMQDIPEPTAARTDSASPGSLLSKAYSTGDIVGLIAATGAGTELLGHFQRGEAELPKLVHNSQLAAADRETARDAVFMHEENRVALFIKNEKFSNNRPHIIF
ncbi:MAG: hypothetical protein Q8O90_09150, partial [Elusimicrobiota bacterium]|nr:hypothetical protein [Elusimicrobiota bacterium]